MGEAVSIDPDAIVAVAEQLRTRGAQARKACVSSPDPSLPAEGHGISALLAELTRVELAFTAGLSKCLEQHGVALETVLIRAVAADGGG